MTTQWSLDYCLTCDRQTSGEAYCSQNCRLADLETSSVSSSSASSSPTSPTHLYGYSHVASSSASSSSSSSSPAANGFYLPPAFDFAAYRHSRSTSASRPYAIASGRNPPASRPVSMCLPTAFANSSAVRSLHGRAASSPRLLSPSSSQASLSSLQNTGQAEGISRQAREELREYTNSFDQVRDLRRRMTSS